MRPKPSTTRARLDAAFLATQPVRAREPGAGLHDRRGGVGRHRHGRQLAVVDPVDRAAPRNCNFGAVHRVRALRLLPRGPDVCADPRRRARSRDRPEMRFTVIGVLRDTMPFEMAGIWTSQRALAVRRPRLPDGAPFALARRRRRAVRHASNPRSSPTACRRTRSRSSSPTPSRSMVFDRLIEGFMGLGLIVGVAALGVIARARSSSAASRSACCGRSGSRQRRCGSLPARVGDSSRSPRSSSARRSGSRGIQRHRRRAAPGDLARQCISSCRGSTWRSSSWS